MNLINAQIGVRLGRFLLQILSIMTVEIIIMNSRHQGKRAENFINYHLTRQDLMQISGTINCINMCNHPDDAAQTNELAVATLTRSTPTGATAPPLPRILGNSGSLS